MDDLQFSWYNLHDQDQDQSFDFDSENMFLNPIHQLSPTNWADQAIAAADFICSNPFLELKDATTNVTANTADTSPECLLSGTNSSTDDATDSKGLLSNNNINAAGNNDGRISGGVSSGDSSQCSLGKRPITGVRVSDKPKKCKTNTGGLASSNINFQQPGNAWETDTEAIAQMKAMIYREAAFRPVSFAVETVVEKPKRKNVRISSDPQTVAARQRRERISERIRRHVYLSRIFDGRTGDPFEQPVIIEKPYILKLIHQVDDKIHGRSGGRYSRLTQQPLKGRAKKGAQQVGEMEVWALEGFGVAYILQEMLTYKSDHIRARQEVLGTIIFGGRIPTPEDAPESFRLFVRELRSLALELNHFLVSEKTFQLNRKEA
ncbi:hypothetical protein L1987_30862 [Smallanthus sonchifolius]|uniref:Uncharacterized protein n=1 Tax=Smallanthus sonchifolius TaxID=185202 RepID=A0ACB9I5H3_9ASTR|nr:hypothetical protein L1987_30862 [Smallanthus sonchifolius]